MIKTYKMSDDYGLKQETINFLKGKKNSFLILLKFSSVWLLRNSSNRSG
jgi:hypothetical protein